jgi:hypothetical protein
VSRPRGRARALAIAAAALGACGVHYSTPRTRARDARFGYLGGAGPAPSREALCRDWRGAVAARDPHATRHISFPETDPARACFTEVRYDPDGIRVGAPPPGCAYPAARDTARLTALAARLEAGAAVATQTTSLRGERAADEEQRLFPCGLRASQRALALRHDARVLRAEAARLEQPGAPRYPYAAVIAFGYGWPDQNLTSLVDWTPADRCHPPSRADMDRLGVMVPRTRRVAEALRAGVAPIAIVSGGTEHSRMVEAFAMLYLLRCLEGVRADRVLLEPCAEHTHTNLRNAGRWLVALGGRAGFVVTDDGMQADYLQEWNGFELVNGGVDARALRDWAYLLGAWRQAVRGPSEGFWFSPYRFWAEPREGLGSVSCLEP